MTDEPTPEEEDFDSLLGAYALDAVDDDERARIEAYLRESPRAADEVAAYREVLAYLDDDAESPPPEVWDRIASSLEERPPPFRLVVAKPRRPARWQILAAAAAVVVAAAIAGVVGTRIGDSGGDSLAAQVERAQSDPAVRTVALSSTDGRLNIRALVDPEGDAWLDADGLPALERARTYQLWAIRGGEPVSLGVLGPDPKIVKFRADGPIDALAVTDEAAGGAPAPTNAPLVSGTY